MLIQIECIRARLKQIRPDHNLTDQTKSKQNQRLCAAECKWFNCYEQLAHWCTFGVLRPSLSRTRVSYLQIINSTIRQPVCQMWRPTRTRAYVRNRWRACALPPPCDWHSTAEATTHLLQSCHSPWACIPSSRILHRQGGILCSYFSLSLRLSHSLYYVAQFRGPLSPDRDDNSLVFVARSRWRERLDSVETNKHKGQGQSQNIRLSD